MQRVTLLMLYRLGIGVGESRRHEIDTEKVAASHYPELLAINRDGEQEYKPLSRSSSAGIVREP